MNLKKLLTWGSAVVLGAGALTLAVDQTIPHMSRTKRFSACEKVVKKDGLDKIRWK